MTTLLAEAFAKASQLSPAEQDLVAARLLAELAEEDGFDRVIAASSGKLAGPAQEAIEEFRADATQELDPDAL
jgi:hypothetical protein